METRSEPTSFDPLSHVIANAAAALSRRLGEGQQQQQALAHSAATLIREFQPQNVIEAMLASQSVMFHSLLNEAVSAAQARGEPLKQNDSASSGLIALNNAFHRNLTSFQRSRKARTEQKTVAPETIIADANKALAQVTAQTPTRQPAQATPPRVIPAKMAPEPANGPLPGPLRTFTPQQQLAAAVDGTRSGPPSTRLSDSSGVNRTGTSYAAASIVAAGGASIPRFSAHASSRA